MSPAPPSASTSASSAGSELHVEGSPREVAGAGYTPCFQAPADVIQNKLSPAKPSTQPRDSKVKAPAPRRAFEADYELRDNVLGTGVSGSVYEAISRKTGRSYAVKSFKIKEMPSKSIVNLFREVQVQGAVRHPNIVELRGVYQSETEVHLVLEKLDGGELFDRLLSEGRLEEHKAAHIVVQLVSAIAYMHARGVMHRDIKPENILFDRQGSESIRLIDFGYATVVDSRSKLVQRCGTIQYIAPEVLAGDGYDERADLWSIGCVVYTMLTMKALYGGDDNEVQRKNKTGAVDFSRTFKTISPLAQNFILSCLSKDPCARPDALSLLRHPWLMAYAGKAALQADSDHVLLSKQPLARHVPLLALRPNSKRNGSEGCLASPRA